MFRFLNRFDPSFLKRLKLSKILNYIIETITLNSINLLLKDEIFQFSG